MPDSRFGACTFLYLYYYKDLSTRRDLRRTFMPRRDEEFAQARSKMKFQARFRKLAIPLWK